MRFYRRRHRACGRLAVILVGLVGTGLVLIFALAAVAAMNDLPGEKHHISLLSTHPSEAHKQFMEDYQKGLREQGLTEKILLVQDANFIPSEVSGSVYAVRHARELMTRSDLDVIVAVGKEAALALLHSNNGYTPVLVMDMDGMHIPELMGNVGRTTARNFLIHRQSDCWSNMFRYFQMVVPFERMGIFCPARPDPHTQKYLNRLPEIARELGFEVRQQTRGAGDYSREGCLRALVELEKWGMDAFNIIEGGCFDPNKGNPGPLLEHLTKNRVATLSTNSTEIVRHGALIGFSALDSVSHGRILAAMTASVLKGKNLERMRLLDLYKPKVSINLQTASELRLNFSPNILIAADIIYPKADWR